MKSGKFMATAVAAFVGAGLVLMGGCDGGGGDEAGGETASVNVAGTWNLYVDGDHLAGVLVLSQSGTSIGGTYYPGGPGSGETAGTVSGSLDGSDIQLSIVYSHGYNDAANGVVDGDRMSGTGSGWENVDTAPTFSDDISWTAVKS